MRAPLIRAFLRIPERMKHFGEPKSAASRTFTRRCWGLGRRCQAAQQLSSLGRKALMGGPVPLGTCTPRAWVRRVPEKPQGTPGLPLPAVAAVVAAVGEDFASSG